MKTNYRLVVQVLFNYLGPDIAGNQRRAAMVADNLELDKVVDESLNKFDQSLSANPNLRLEQNDILDVVAENVRARIDEYLSMEQGKLCTIKPFYDGYVTLYRNKKGTLVTEPEYYSHITPPMVQAFEDTETKADLKGCILGILIVDLLETGEPLFYIDRSFYDDSYDDDDDWDEDD